MKKTATARAFAMKALTDEGPGVHEAIVSVFGNVDLGGDRVLAGAFAGSIEKWKSTGDPIPVLWSHQWDDPRSHIGVVLDAKEMLPGDPALPEELAGNGGLWVKYRLDVDDATTYAPTVDRLLNRRSVKEFSFAYDVLRERRSTDGANDLAELDIIEIGPTMKGMNPATVALKSLDVDALYEATAITPAQFGKLVTMLDTADAKAVVMPTHTFIPKADDAGRCSICELTRNTLPHLNLLSAEPEGAKAVVTLTGSLEETLDAYYQAGVQWASGENIGNGGFYALWPEGTYPEESRSVVLVEGWDDPIGEGIFYELAFVTNGDGALEVDSATEVVIEGVVRAKAGRKAVERLGRKAVTPEPQPEPEGTPGLNPEGAAVLLDALALELDS